MGACEDPPRSSLLCIWTPKSSLEQPSLSQRARGDPGATVCHVDRPIPSGLRRRHRKRDQSFQPKYLSMRLARIPAAPRSRGTPNRICPCRDRGLSTRFFAALFADLTPQRLSKSVTLVEIVERIALDVGLRGV